MMPPRRPVAQAEPLSSGRGEQAQGSLRASMLPQPAVMDTKPAKMPLPWPQARV